MTDISINPNIYCNYGNIKISYCIFRNVDVLNTPPRMKKVARSVERDIREHLSSESWEKQLNIDTWMKLFNNMGLMEIEERPASVQLVERILSGKNIYKINNIVDAANITAAKYLVPVGVFNFDSITPPIKLRMALPGENMIPLFQEDPIEVNLKEIVYTDASGIFSRYSKDADRTKITDDTKNVFAVVDGTDEIDRGYLEEARSFLISLIKDTCGEQLHIELGYQEAKL